MTFPFWQITPFLIAFALPGIASGGPFSPRKRPILNLERSEELCDRYGASLARKFSANPKELVHELDELIVKLGSRGPDRVNPLSKGGRMLASLTGPPQEKKVRRAVQSSDSAALEVRVNLKLTEANVLLKQSKRLGFFDEDEERELGVQDACAKAVYERAVILERMMR